MSPVDGSRFVTAMRWRSGDRAAFRYDPGASKAAVSLPLRSNHFREPLTPPGPVRYASVPFSDAVKPATLFAKLLPMSSAIGYRIAADFEPFRIETLGHQRAVADVKEPIGWSKCRLEPGRDEKLPILRIERRDENPGILTLTADGEIQEVPAVRQEVRMTMGELLARLVELGHRRHSAAGPLDTKQGSACRRREDDDIISIPGPAMTIQRVAKRERRSALQIDLLQSAVGEERDKAAVR